MTGRKILSDVLSLANDGITHVMLYLSVNNKVCRKLQLEKENFYTQQRLLEIIKLRKHTKKDVFGYNDSCFSIHAAATTIKMQQ